MSSQEASNDSQRAAPLSTEEDEVHAVASTDSPVFQSQAIASRLETVERVVRDSLVFDRPPRPSSESLYPDIAAALPDVELIIENDEDETTALKRAAYEGLLSTNRQKSSSINSQEGTDAVAVEVPGQRRVRSFATEGSPLISAAAAPAVPAVPLGPVDSITDTPSSHRRTNSTGSLVSSVLSPLDPVAPVVQIGEASVVLVASEPAIEHLRRRPGSVEEAKLEEEFVQVAAEAQPVRFEDLALEMSAEDDELLRLKQAAYSGYQADVSEPRPYPMEAPEAFFQRTQLHWMRQAEQSPVLDQTSVLEEAVRLARARFEADVGEIHQEAQIVDIASHPSELVGEAVHAELIRHEYSQSDGLTLDIAREAPSAVVSDMTETSAVAVASIVDEHQSWSYADESQFVDHRSVDNMERKPSAVGSVEGAASAEVVSIQEDIHPSDAAAEAEAEFVGAEYNVTVGTRVGVVDTTEAAVASAVASAVVAEGSELREATVMGLVEEDGPDEFVGPSIEKPPREPWMDAPTSSDADLPPVPPPAADTASDDDRPEWLRGVSTPSQQSITEEDRHSSSASSHKGGIHQVRIVFRRSP